MSKVALLGPKYLVNPLAACGIDVAACETGKQGGEVLAELVRKGEHAVIFITERLAAEILPEIEALENEEVNIALLPDHRGSTGLFKDRLENLIRKAIGTVNV